ncbi:DUF928 domain-containing protein [Phormidium sp. CLA17]|uniref:DUF928 domain-containing protein n=1 Tax=Leptolyngbya sp. Cla-17 TaxID=2803751 RepID=UPI001491A5B0|nr:DUF928 domain-containing protein [Leptolyngbya sp. Cla-17]MBM0744580.1 DUF928 domain-containing protein [Leptolyngbya sp. Cla-17]
MRFSRNIKAVFLALLLGTIAAIDLVEPALARPVQSSNSAKTQLARRRLNFRVGVRPSRFRVGGFSRAASCGNQPLTALVPPQTQGLAAGQKEVQDPVDKTTVDRPTFFIHLAALPAKTAQFTLQNEAGTEQLHSVKFNLTDKAGIVGITLPKSAPALQVGQKYVWQVSVACDSENAANTVVVSSWVERVHPTTATGDQLMALAEQGVWQDALSLLALRRFQQPGDRAAEENWSALMEDAGLPQFKQAKIVQIVRN